MFVVLSHQVSDDFFNEAIDNIPTKCLSHHISFDKAVKKERKEGEEKEEKREGRKCEAEMEKELTRGKEGDRQKRGMGKRRNFKGSCKNNHL